MTDAPAVLLTGATSGLGRYLARELAGSGWRVLPHGRDPERVADLCAELGRDARGCVADLASLADVRDLAASVRAQVPRLDVLVNNAGVGFGAPGEGRQLSADGHAGITLVAGVEEGVEATMRLIIDPDLDGVTGQFFDGLKASRARPEASDPQFRARLAAVTDRMLGENPGLAGPRPPG